MSRCTPSLQWGGAIPYISPRECWGCGTEAAALGGRSSTLIVSLKLKQSASRQIAEVLHQYGHKWAAIEKLHWCLLSAQEHRAEHGSVPIRQLALPRYFSSSDWTDARPVLAELDALLSGSCISIVRNAGVPACGPSEMCCANRTEVANVEHPTAAVGRERGPDVVQLQVGFFDAMPAAARPAFRLHVWRNRAMEHATADTVTFVSSEGASSGRRIADEELVAQRVRAYFRERRPGLLFAHQAMAELSYIEELRLFRRSAVFISLFGSSLHNCRFLPPESVVIELHGALKQNWLDTGGYGGLCAESMGLRWAALAVDGSAPTEKTRNLSHDRWRWSLRRDYSVARVNASGLVDLLESVLFHGGWWQAHRTYLSSVTKPAMPNPKHTRRDVERWAQLPQYSTPTWM